MSPSLASLAAHPATYSIARNALASLSLISSIRSGSCGSKLPVRRSTVPPGVFNSQGSASQISTVAAWRRSDRASRSIAATVLALAIFAASSSSLKVLVLLRHRNGWTPGVLRGALQHGHRTRVVARATIRCRRIVAIEFATCRSGRTGSAPGWTTLGNAKRRALIGGVAGS